jgi:hypothetical protein
MSDSYKEEKAKALQEVADAGFPPINAFTTDMMTPKLLSAFLKKELGVVAG